MNPHVQAFATVLVASRAAPDPLGAARLRLLALRDIARAANDPKVLRAALDVLADHEAAIVAQLERQAEAEREAAERRAVADDALRQVAALEADGGPSDLTVRAWLADVESGGR